MLGYAQRRVAASTVLSPQTQEDRNVRLLYLNTAMVGVATGGIAAFMPVFLARLGASSGLLGWFNSLPSLVLTLMLIPGSAIAERFADQVAVRTRYVRLIRSMYLVCALLPFVVPVEWLPIALVIAWVFTVLPEAVAMPAWTSVLARAMAPRRRAVVNSTRWALLAVVTAVSSAGFGWLLDMVAFPYNYQLVFFLSAAFSWFDPYVFSFIKVAPLVARPRSEGRARPSWREAREYLRPVLRSRPFLTFLGATFPYRVALNMMAPLFSLFWVNVLHAPDTLIGLRGTVGHAVLVIGYLTWGRLANRIGHRNVLWLSAGGLALYPIATALSPSAAWLLPVAAIWGITVGGIDVGLFDMMLAACPEERQPLFAGVWNMVARAAMVVGPLVGAAVADATSLGTALIISGVVQALSTGLFLLLPRDC